MAPATARRRLKPATKLQLARSIQRLRSHRFELALIVRKRRRGRFYYETRFDAPSSSAATQCAAAVGFCRANKANLSGRSHKLLALSSASLPSAPKDCQLHSRRCELCWCRMLAAAAAAAAADEPKHEKRDLLHRRHLTRGIARDNHPAHIQIDDHSMTLAREH